MGLGERSVYSLGNLRKWRFWRHWRRMG